MPSSNFPSRFSVMSVQSPIQKGSEVSFAKTVTEDDINQFAALSGDFAPNHVDEEFMKKSAYGKRIAHGALLVAYASRASSQIIEDFSAQEQNATPVSLGYDRIRFIKPVFIDETITIHTTRKRHDPTPRSKSKTKTGNWSRY